MSHGQIPTSNPYISILINSQSTLSLVTPNTRSYVYHIVYFLFFSFFLHFAVLLEKSLYFKDR